LPLPQMG